MIQDYKVKIDHEFGVIQIITSGGTVFQYTRSNREEVFAPQIGTFDDGTQFVNTSITSLEFEDYVRDLRKV